MRTLVITILFVFCRNLTVAQSDQTIESGKVGLVSIGMSVDELYGHFGQDSVRLFDQFLEGTFSPALDINNGKLIAEIECGKVWRVKVRSDAYRTRDGIGVGSSLKDLLKSHPKATFLQGEGNYVVYVSDLHLSFILSQEGLGDGNFYDKLGDLPPEIRVGEILVLPR